MFDVNEKIMQVKGAVIDFNRWRRDKLIKKIEKLEDKLDNKNEHIDDQIGKWLDGWSKIVNDEGYRTKDNKLIDFKQMVLESE